MYLLKLLKETLEWSNTCSVSLLGYHPSDRAIVWEESNTQLALRKQ
jgi:hypothetical protein